MKVEIRVHIQKYESQIGQEKYSKYYELEQQIHHLTSKSCLRKMERRVLQSAETTLQDK
jgi:hypothetical protein